MVVVLPVVVASEVVARVVGRHGAVVAPLGQVGLARRCDGCRDVVVALPVRVEVVVAVRVRFVGRHGVALAMVSSVVRAAYPQIISVVVAVEDFGDGLHGLGGVPPATACFKARVGGRHGFVDALLGRVVVGSRGVVVAWLVVVVAYRAGWRHGLVVTLLVVVAVVVAQDRVQVLLHGGRHGVVVALPVNAVVVADRVVGRHGVVVVRLGSVVVAAQVVVGSRGEIVAWLVEEVEES